jgi:hypothetical protein
MYAHHARPAHFQPMGQAHVHDVNQENTMVKLGRIIAVIAMQKMVNILRSRA